MRRLTDTEAQYIAGSRTGEALGKLASALLEDGKELFAATGSFLADSWGDLQQWLNKASADGKEQVKALKKDVKEAAKQVEEEL